MAMSEELLFGDRACMFALARSGSKKIHACPCGCACMYTCTRTRMRTHPFPISWKKVHILSLRRDQSAEILCMVSPLLLPITAVPLNHGRLEGRAQNLDDSDVLDVFCLHRKPRPQDRLCLSCVPPPPGDVRKLSVQF